MKAEFLTYAARGTGELTYRINLVPEDEEEREALERGERVASMHHVYTRHSAELGEEVALTAVGYQPHFAPACEARDAHEDDDVEAVVLMSDGMQLCAECASYAPDGVRVVGAPVAAGAARG